MQKFFHRCQEAIFDSPFFVFLPLAFLASIVVNGVWVSPASTRLWSLARDPSTNPFSEPKNDWLLDNYLLPWIAHLVGASDSLKEYVLFSFLLLVLGIGLTIWILRLRSGDEVARSAMLLFVVSPVSLVALGWLGYVDSLTIIFGFICAFAWKQPLLLLTAGFLMGTNHFTQGVFIAAISLIGQSSRRTHWHKSDILGGALLLVGLIAGFMTLKIYLGSIGIVQHYNRFDYFLDRGLISYLEKTFTSFGVLIYSLFGGLWVVVYLWCRDSSARARFYMGIAIFLAFCATSMNLDQTRVFSLLAWPLILIMLDDMSKREYRFYWTTKFRGIITMAVLVGIILPKLIVWNGSTYSSLIYKDILTGINIILYDDKVDFYDQRWLNQAFR